MSELRSPGSLGPTRRGPNPAPVSKNVEGGNSNATSAPGGEVKRPEVKAPIKAGNRKTAR